jgi:hypothetical protein
MPRKHLFTDLDDSEHSSDLQLECADSACDSSDMVCTEHIYCKGYASDCHSQSPSLSKSRLGRVVKEPNLDARLHSLLLLLKKSAFYVEDRLEPSIGSDECNVLLAGITAYPLTFTRGLEGKSIYSLFINTQERTCRICGSIKGSPVRAISCVRSDLGHRPFHCPGIKEGCKRCGPNDG